MLLVLRKKIDSKLIVRDILDLDFNMMTETIGGVTYISINSVFRLAETFESIDEAEKKMMEIVNIFNTIEEELKNHK